MKVLSIVFVLVLASTSAKSCILSESGPSPYLIRIFESEVDPLTYGHGSLIREDKVLSTCTPFKGLPMDLVNEKWRLSGYNFKEKCEQKRHPLEIKMHEACKMPYTKANGPWMAISFDLAIWTVEPFTVEGMPFLWGNGKYLPPAMTIVRSLLSSSDEGKLNCETVVFGEAKSRSAQLRPNTSIEFIGQSECMDMIKNITLGNKNDDIGADMNHIFCVCDKGFERISSQNAPDAISADWYSGAPLTMLENNSSILAIPIGLISRVVTVNNSHSGMNIFRIVMGFHEGVYEFLRSSGIETSNQEPTLSTTSKRASGKAGVRFETWKKPTCEISESGPYPYLIRISENISNYASGIITITYGHGSLVKENKVLSTCTPFKNMPKNLHKTDWTLTGYNFEKQCQQKRKPEKIVMHESCQNNPFPTSNGPITRDLALWTVKPFEIIGMPFLWGNGKPQPPPPKTVKSIIDSLLKFKKAIKIGLFKYGESYGPELQKDAKTNFINWFVCLDMLKSVTNSTGDMANGLSSSTSKIEGFYDYFCGYDVGIKWINSRRKLKPVTADWYSGAAVIYEHPSGTKVPIGLLSRGVTTSITPTGMMNFRIIMGFHEGVYKFLISNGIAPSAIESPSAIEWFRSEIFSTSDNRRRSMTADPHYRKSSSQNNRSSRPYTRNLWISHLSLLGCLSNDIIR